MTTSIAVGADNVALVEIRGVTSTNARSLRYRIDGGAWTNVTIPTGGATQDQQLLATTPTLDAGAHTLEVEWLSGASVFVDFFDVVETPEPQPEEDPHVLAHPDNTTRQALGALVTLATGYFVVKVGRL